MNRKRITVTLEIAIDLDPVPGSFHETDETTEMIQRLVKGYLNYIVPHYNPTVDIKL